jgi:SSS family solute:Na+ symporter
MLLGMFWKRCTSTAAFWGLLAGMLVSFMLFLLPRMGLLDASLFTFSDNPSDMTRNLWQAWWAWMVTFGLTIGISFVTTAKSDHELQGLVKGLTGDTESDETGLLSSPGFWAIIALVALIGLNLYFW